MQRCPTTTSSSNSRNSSCPLHRLRRSHLLSIFKMAATDENQAKSAVVSAPRRTVLQQCSQSHSSQSHSSKSLAQLRRVSQSSNSPNHFTLYRTLSKCLVLLVHRQPVRCELPAADYKSSNAIQWLQQQQDLPSRSCQGRIGCTARP